MELSFLLIQQIMVLFIIIFLGFLIVKKNILTEQDSKVISTIVLYIVCPCTIISAFQIQLTPETLIGLCLSFLGAIIVHIIFIPLVHVMSKVFHFTSIEKASLIYSNAGNLIIPLVSAILGPEWVLYTSGYMVVQTILIWTHGKNLVCEETSYDLKKIFLNVNVISIFIGLFLFIFKIQLPTVISSTISGIGVMIGPLSMLVIGMLLGNMKFRSLFENIRTYLVCLIRLIVLPLLVILAFRLIPFTLISAEAHQVLLITVLAASAPAAATITQFAQIYDKQPEYASLLNVISVLLCIVTMPLMVMIYQVI